MNRFVIFAFLCIFPLVLLSQNLSSDIRLNQIGFLPGAPKVAVVVNTSSSSFSIKSKDLTQTFFTGELYHEKQWSASGEKVKIASFNSFTETGEFVIVVEDKGKSYPFFIYNDLFTGLLKASIKAFYYNRNSTALLSEHAGIYARPSGHPDTAVIVHPSAATVSRPAGTKLSTPYGWYDAGDYNKYIVNSGISTFSLLSAFENFPFLYDTLDLNIPESNNNMPDILDEALWNIKWMFTMQDPEDGGIYHKTTNAGFDGMVMPHLAKTTRYVTAKSTSAALDFAAIMAMTARIYKDYLPAFADSCLDKALFAWDWAKKNPNKQFTNPSALQGYPAIQTGGYGDAVFTDEFFWAATELYITTNESTFLEDMNLSSSFDIPGWPNVRTLGLISLVTHRIDLGSSIDTTAAKNKLVTLASGIKEYQKNTSPYKIPINNFYWGSNGLCANQGLIMACAYLATKDQDYFAGAISALDYLLGRNATTFCFVTGFGSKNPKHIHHRPSEGDGISEPIPGSLAGGPNPQNVSDCGTSAYPSTLPALAYLDNVCSYSTNEIAINWNAPLVFLTGFIVNAYDHNKNSFNWPSLIEKNSISDYIEVYPNPADNIIHLSSHYQGIYEITIFSTDNRIVYHQTEDNAKTTHIDISGFMPGIYLLKIQSQTKDTAFKKIVIH